MNETLRTILIAIGIGAVIGSITFVTIRSQNTELEKVKITQEEKSERGHWLWGHFDDFAEKDD